MLILPSLNVKASDSTASQAENHDVQSNDTLDHQSNLENEEELVENSSASNSASLLPSDESINNEIPEETKTFAQTPSHHLAPHSHPVIHRLTGLTTQPSAPHTIDNNIQTTNTAHTHTGPVTSQSQTYVEETIQGTFGQLHVDKNGNYEFTLNPKSPAFLLLQKQEPGTDTFTIHLTDGTQLIIQVPVVGKQDSPNIAGKLSGHVIEDHNVDKHGFLTTSGKVDVIDPDHGESTLTPDTIHGQFGTLSINAQGYWQYTVDNSQSTIQALTNKTSLTETFTIHTKDGTPQLLQMSIGGENDNALVSGYDKGQVYEDLSPHVTGKLSISDLDTGEAHFVNTNITGTFGKLHMTDSGQWTYELDNTKPYVQALGKGETATDIFTVHSADGTPHQVTITINGTNDKAVIGGTNSGSVTEEYHLQTSGILTVTDVDNGEAHFASTNITGTFGTLHMTSSGQWTYDLDNTKPYVQALGKSGTATDIFTVHSADGTPHQVTITINGSNNTAIVSSATVTVDETDKAITTSGTLTSTDVDNPDNTFTPDSITGTHGNLTIDSHGHWAFTANSAFNQLNVGDKVEETFTVTSVDGTPSTIKVTINGTNDAATVSTAIVTVDETDKAITTSGTLTSTDVDNPGNTFTPDSITGTHGDLTIDANGHWVFTANSAFNQLNVGDKVEETFTVTSVDGTPSSIKVTINGTNDAATVSSATVTVDETDTAITTSGTLTSTDVDNPDNAFTPDSITGTHGDLTIDANGHWVFTANSAFNQLNVGDKVEETFTVTSVDGTQSTIKVTINGTNDTATVSSATVTVDETDTAITTSGTLTSTDVDNPDNTFTPDTITGTHGDLTIDANGHWVFTANSAFNQLNVGDKVEETFTVTSVDGTPSTIKVTINGTNDAATVSSATVAVDETDTAITTSGTLTSTDVDNPDNTFTPDSITGTNGDLTIDTNGHWVFTANSAFNQLNVGDKVEETFTVTSVDGTPSTIKVTINGTNDAATVSSATVVVDETDTAITTSGTLTSTDVDSPDNTFTPGSITGTHGDLTIDANGHWVFTANSAFNQLNVGDKVEETFTVTSVDGTQSTIKVTINGTNDAATVSSATVTVDETDTAITTSGTLTSTDVDNPDNTFAPASITGTHGGLTIDANGHWVFTANSAFNQLNVGDKVEETFTVASVDGTQSTVKVTINGTNDRPTISGTSSGAVIEQGLNTAGTPDATGSLTATDLDKSDTITWAINQPQGQWGTLSIDQNGHWHYQLDNSAGGAADKLASGEHQSEQFWITATDSAGATVPHKIVIDVQGSNDKPIVSAWTQLPAGKEDQSVTIKASDLLTHASDVDSSDVLHVTNLQATHGHLVDNKDGTYTFTPDKDFNGEIRLTYDVVDGHGGSVSTQAKFDLTATPDNAIITDAQTNADLRGVTEDRGYIDTHYQLHYDGKLNIQDPDAGEAQFDPNIGPQTYQGIGYDTKLGGHILLMRDGHYTYTLDNRNIQNLAQGEVKHDSAVIRSADGTTHTIELTVHGTNDAPTINAQSHSVTEGGSVLNGQMVGQDIDTGATLTYSAPQIDGLVVNPDGSYSFNPAHSSYQSLASGVTKTLTVPVTVTDEHNASSTQNLSITITGVNNSAVIGGVDTGDVHEGHTYTAPDGSMSGGYVDDRSPDHMHGNIGKIWNDEIHTDGHLNIVDPDSGEGFAQTGTYQGTHGHVILQSNGDWSYYASIGQDATGRKIDHLGQGESITDTVTVKSADGTTHDIHITIHGDNDRPYCSSEVQLNSGKEDLAQTITTTELLTNTVDVDTNDAGQLSIANLHADHGTIVDNKDGTFTFTPTKDYNGSVHFTYDVKDAHGGTTHTGANTTLVATPDKAIISEVTTGSVIEDGQHATHNNGTTTELANGRLQVIDPDSSEDKFQYSQFGETRIHDPFGGMLRIDSAGNWGYSVDNAALQHLAQGQIETVTYRVHSFDGTAYDLNIDVVGTNDAPTVTKVVLSNGTEDTNYQMQASQFGFTDIDTGDTLHSIAITHLPPAAQGKFVLDGHDITAGQPIAASDIAKLQFVPTPNFNGDVQFKFTVNDGHVDSQEATNTLHIDAVSDAAQFTGRDTGDVHEGHTYTAPDGTMSGGYVDDRSPDHMHGNIGKIWNDEIHTDGHLNIVDPDSGESHAQTGTYQGTHGHVILQSNGDWSYYASIGQDATGRKIDHLGQGESITDTVTVKSADGTTHDIHITIHGDNDRPYCSSEVQLNSGKEDLAQTITTTELLANTVDVDTNDAGQLSIANLHADHGTLVDNKDGTFTFTPDHNFNGKVHFTYDVKDAHGGVTHTGASTTLLPSNDAATLQPTLASNFVTEDHLKSGTSTNELWSGWKNLDIQDIDSPSEAKVTQIEVNGVKHTVPANFAMNLAGVHGTFNFTHSTDGHDKWSYSVDNSHAEVQSLSHGDSLTDTITLITADGTRIPLTAKILGTDDHVIIDTPDALTAALGTAVEDKVTSISGTLLAHDSDSKDSVTFTAGNSVGAYGTLHVDSNGQWHYDLDHSKANALQQGETKAEGFDITAVSTDGSTATKHIEVLVQGSNDKATISVTSNPDVYEDRSSTSVEIISGKLSAVDPDHDQSAFSTDVGKRHDPFNSGVHGGLNISKDGSWTYTVNNSQIQQLAAGQEEHVQYNVHTVGGDYHVIDIKIVGTNDIPTVSATTLAHGTEDTHYQMQASQFGFTDIDTGDTLHSIAITDLPAATQGKFVLDGHDITAGQSIATADIAKLQFVPATDFNGDVQFKFTVNDGHANSAEATNTLHIDAVGDAATISGADTGSVTEDRNVHPSVQGNYSNKLEAQGHLTAIDPDAGESGFDYHTLISVPSHPNWAPYQSALGGELEIDQQGRWHYYIDNRKPEVQSLGAGETLTDTVTIQSKDGTPHVITLTFNGTNDDPVLSVAQTTPTTGTLTETDVDVNDTHTFSVVNSTGQFGSLSVDPDSGAYIYTANGSVAGMSYNAATHTYHGTDVFEVKVADNHGGESSKFITFDANGHVSVVPGQSPTISTSVPSNPLVTTTQPSLPAGTNTPPNNAVTVDLAASSDTGTSDTDNLTKDSTPTITGHTDIPYSQVTIYDGSTPIGHAVSDGSGQYSVAVSSLSNGDHNLSAKALAPSSVLPATSSILPLHVDTVIAPLQVSLTHDTGSNLSDLITSDGSLTITGQEAGATVEYSTDNGHTWTSSFTPQSGSNTVNVRQTDAAGNISASSSLTFTLDNTATAPSVSLTSDSGSSSSDNITNVGDLTIGGIEQGATVEYSTDSGVHWSTQLTPNEGVNNVQVRQTDVAGNVSPSASLTYTLDTQTDIRVNSAQVDQHGQGMMVQVYLPKDSEVTLLEITSDGGGAPLLVDLKTVQIQGIGSSVSHPDHQYQEFVGIDLSSLPDGNLTIRVAGKDAAGNTVTAQSSAGSNYVLDTTASVSDDTNTAIEDSTIPVSGNLLSNDADATTVTTTGDIQGTYGTFHLSSDGSYTYTLNNQLSVIQQLDSTSSPLVDSIAYTARDNHGNQATAHLAISIQGTDDNHAPVVTAHSVSTDEDTTHTFSTAEFGYTDQDGDALHFITVGQLPTNGLLLLNGKAVTTNQQISKADLDAGHLTFTPIHNENGANYAHFTFTANDGQQDSASATMTLNVNAVNDTATFTGDAGSMTEDTSLHHNVHVTGASPITNALECTGHLVVSDVDGQGEAALDLNGQQYLNHNGNYGHFIVSAKGTWAYVADNDNQQVQDLDNGQILTDSVEVTSKGGTKHSITVTINGTTDKPVLHSLSDSGVQHSGPIEGNLLSGIGTNEGVSGAATDTDFNAHLVLQDIQVKDPVSGYVKVTPGHPHTMVGIGTLAIEANGHYTFTPEAGFTGTVPSMVYRVGDDGGNPRGDSAQNRLSIEVTPPAQHAPTATPQTVTSDEDQTHTFNTSEFGYSDADGDALNHITITQLPTNGTLMLNGVLVTTNQQISKADLDAGHLTFTPIHDQNGANYANIGFTANDGHQDSTNATIILNVNAVNDDPTVGSSFKSSPEDTPMRFTKADFKYSDVDGDPLSHITITNVAHGTLSLNGHSVSVGDDVSAADVSSLVFTPTPNYSSAGLNGLGAVQFTANDGHVDSKEGSIFINVAPVDNPATFSGDSTGQAQEDTHTQTSGTLSVTDPDGTQGFIAVQGGAGIVGSKGYGHAHIDSNGHWTYNLYNNHAIVQQLKQGQTDTETITVQAKDGTTHDIVITITGTNDAPTVSEHTPGSSHSVNEDTNPNARGQLDISDIDGDAVSVTVDPSHSAQFGSVQFDSQTNTWAYHLNNANPQVDALNDGDTLTDRFTLLVDDGHGGQVSKEVVMTINGHTDPIPYTPPTISVTVDTRNAHHVTAGITASTVQAYAHSIGQSARTVSGHHEVEGHGHSEIFIVQGSLHDEAELKSGNDILYIGGRLTDEEIEGGSGRDTLILGAYNRNNAPRLHSDKIGNMEIESIENIILGDGTVLKGHLPPNFPSIGHDHYEVPVNIQAHLSSSDESVSSIRLTHLQQGLTLQSNGHNINANQDGSYTVPANGHFVVISTHPISSGHHYFETEVTTHNSVTGVTAVTTEDLHGHIQSHVNPPPPPPPPVQHDEPELSPLDSVQDFTVALDDSLSADAPLDSHAPVSHEHPVGAAAYLDALGIQPNASPTTGHDQPADMDIVLAQVDQQHAADYDQTHLDMSDALEHHDAANNHNQDDEHHHHHDVDGLPDIDPNN
ncbi:VCBS domain-containing protein [Vibrio rotiferianus]|uniref:VCBS domain-containing protein n=1 Tax=Vibrio rotiferianus TaxID=190895 RepID=UPI00391B3381